LKEIEKIDEKLAELYMLERPLRENSVIIEGKRISSDDDALMLEECESKINQCNRQKAKIKKDHKDDLDKYERYIEEEKRIRYKDKVYRIDVELDQIMTCFKLSFVNLCSLFLKKCFNDEKMELLTLFESIFQLNGSASILNGTKTIELEMNPKEPKLMDRLIYGLDILNTTNVHDLNNRLIKFGMGTNGDI
jgi:hypothetical protein